MSYQRYILEVRSADDVFTAIQLFFDNWELELRDGDLTGIYGLKIEDAVFTLSISDVDIGSRSGQFFVFNNPDQSFEAAYDLEWDAIYEFVQLINYRFGYNWKFEHYAT